jgi:histidine ammonia-lyase
VIAIEFLSAMQAVDLMKLSDKLSPSLKEIYDAYREEVPFIEEDVILHDYITGTEAFFNKQSQSE